MRAAMLVDSNRIEVRETDQPEPRDGEVLVRVGACGVCKTDYHMFHGTFPVDTPLVLGHESAGTVADSRSAVVSEGERVAINPTIPCHTCTACKRGRTILTDGGIDRCLAD